jgi:tyrosine-protein phosphatase YwqE
MTAHGKPLEVVPYGETFIPQDVFDEYVTSLRSVYRADKYHLLDFNCNTFSAQVIDFLVSGAVPPHIQSKECTRN